MDRGQVWAEAVALVAAARGVRAAFPDRGAMAAVTVPRFGPRPAVVTGAGAALGFLRDEVLMVQAGRAADLTVLDDELANAERVVARVSRPAGVSPWAESGGPG